MRRNPNACADLPRLAGFLSEFSVTGLKQGRDTLSHKLDSDARGRT